MNRMRRNSQSQKSQFCSPMRHIQDPSSCRNLVFCETTHSTSSLVAVSSFSEVDRCIYVLLNSSLLSKSNVTVISSEAGCASESCEISALSASVFVPQAGAHNPVTSIEFSHAVYVSIALRLLLFKFYCASLTV